MFDIGELQSEEEGDTESDEGCYPGKEDGVYGCEYGPLPAPALILYGHECGYAREV